MALPKVLRPKGKLAEPALLEHEEPPMEQFKPKKKLKALGDGGDPIAPAEEKKKPKPGGVPDTHAP